MCLEGPATNKLEGDGTDKRFETGQSRGARGRHRLSGLEILDSAAATQVEEVGASAAVSGAAPLTLGHVGEAMFDTDSLSQLLSTLGRSDQLSKSMLQALVFRNGDGAPRRRRHRASCTQPAATARFRFKLDRGSRREVFGLAGWTCDRQASHVDVKVLLGEELRIRVAGNPWLAQHLTTARQNQRHGTGIDVAAIDVKFDDLQALAPDVLLEFRRCFLLGAIGGRDSARED